jgi:parvulin-like peptidyl-prolyl isomerase
VPPQARAQLAASPQARQEFLRDLKEMLSVAEEARGAGFAARPDVRLQLELSRAFIISREYMRRRQQAGATSQEQVVSKDEIVAFLKEPGQDVKFAEFLQDYMRNRTAQQQQTPLTTVEREELERNWASVMLSSRKGIAAGLDKSRAVQVMITYQHARLLASSYFREQLSQRTKATEPEIDAYLAIHPELDPKEARAKVEDILRRVRAGEDFAKLADEFTQDPSGKGKGGDLGWFGRGMMVKPFEDAAFALKPGEVSGVVETRFGFHIIKLDERREQAGADGKPAEQVHARHILIIPPGAQGRRDAPQTPREQARTGVENEKRTRLLQEVVGRTRVTLPTDFEVNTTITMPPPPAPTGTGGSATRPPVNPANTSQPRPAATPPPRP